ncbi:MAG: hypothetical protein M1818_007915 [Claussenomyces sp. TS43310]|nr:MAG: hypothetical protein M1818_007915 [Claussenomyces sp. TS43310]
MPSFGCVAIAALCLAAPITALSSPVHDFFERALSCPTTGDVQCGNGLPGNFCCPSSEVCMVLANNTTALCCANAEDCQLISPITCDMQAQNVTANPGQPLMTTNFSGTLSTCGSGCCPYGYSCSNGNCVIDPVNAAQSTSSSATSTATITPLLPTSTSSSALASTTTSPAASSSAPSSSPSHCDAYPPSAVLIGFFPGLLAGALVAFLVFCLLGAHHRKRDRDSGSSFGPVAASVSDPIYNETATMRSDFLRRPSPSRQSSNSTPMRQPTIERVRSLFRKSTATTAATASNTYDYGSGSHLPLPSSPEMTNGRGPVARPPRTPNLQREPSSESINIFADPGTARVAAASRSRDSQQTTFTDLLERADLPHLRKGAPVIPPLRAMRESRTS